MTASNVDTLTQINLDDLISSFGWQNHPFLARLLRWLFYFATETFAHQMVEFDACVGEHGLVHASLSDRSAITWTSCIFGRERIPAGPPFWLCPIIPVWRHALALYLAQSHRLENHRA